MLQLAATNEGTWRPRNCRTIAVPVLSSAACKNRRLLKTPTEANARESKTLKALGKYSSVAPNDRPTFVSS